MAITKTNNRMIDGSVVNVLDYGVSTTASAADNTTAFNNAIAQGGRIYVPEGQYEVNSVTINNSCRIFGEGTIYRSAVRSDAAFTITASDVQIEGLRFKGSSYNAEPTGNNQADNAIEVNGGSTPTQLNNFKFSKLDINGFEGVGIRVNYAIDVVIDNNNINYIGYAGIIGLSVVNGIITKNSIGYIANSGGGTNAYGITLTRDATETISDSARSVDCVVEANVVQGVRYWTGIDCHAGYKSIIHNNQVYDCANGIVLQYDSSTEVNKQPCEDLTVRGNMVYGRSTSSENALGIASLGLSSLVNKNIVIDNNFVSGCGSYDDTNGAIYINETTSAEVTNNRVEKSVRHGIGLKGTSANLVVRGNQINGVKDGNTANNRSYIYLDLANISGVLKENRCYNDTGDSSFDGYYGIWYTNGPTTSLVLDANRIKDKTIAFLYDGSSNTYNDFRWILEDNSRQGAGTLLTSGNTSEDVRVELHRNLYGTIGESLVCTANPNPGLPAKITALFKGVYDPNEINVTFYTVDGTTFGSAYNAQPYVSVQCICWED
jgi:hypothetical protein